MPQPPALPALYLLAELARPSLATAGISERCAIRDTRLRRSTHSVAGMFGPGLVVRDADDADALRAAEARAVAWQARALAAEAVMTALRRRVAALEERQNESRVLGPLPICVCHAIFLLLPVDTRLRCREVSRGWHACLSNPELWQLCDVSDTSGVAHRTIALLRAATKRALGTLRALDVSGFQETSSGANGLVKALTEIAMENTEHLEKLRAWNCRKYEGWTIVPTETACAARYQVRNLLALSPKLLNLEVDYDTDYHNTVSFSILMRMVRNEGRYHPLRLQRLKIKRPPEDLVALVAALSTHDSLTDLDISLCSDGMESILGIGALADYACSKLTSLCIVGHRALLEQGPDFFTRLLSSGSCLKELVVQPFESWLGHHNGNIVFTGAAMPAFVAALRASSLSKLHLYGPHLLDTDESEGALDDALAVIYACTYHASLRDVSFYGNNVAADTELVIGQALGALITADAPVEVLNLSAMFEFTAVGLAPIFDGVSMSRGLRALFLREHSFDDAIARDLIFPAVAANSSLRELCLGDFIPDHWPWGIIEALVRARSAGGRAENKEGYARIERINARRLESEEAAAGQSSDWEEDDHPAA